MRRSSSAGASAERGCDRHRRLDRILLPAGLVAGVFGLSFGQPYAFGRASEALATAVFGAWFIACLVLAYRAIRSGNVAMHRRWMIQAFAVGLPGRCTRPQVRRGSSPGRAISG